MRDADAIGRGLLDVVQDFARRPALKVVGGTAEHRRGDTLTDNPIVIHATQQPPDGCPLAELVRQLSIVFVVNAKAPGKRLNRTLTDRAAPALSLQDVKVLPPGDAVLMGDVVPVPAGLFGRVDGVFLPALDRRTRMRAHPRTRTLWSLQTSRAISRSHRPCRASAPATRLNLRRRSSVLCPPLPSVAGATKAAILGRKREGTDGA